MESETSSRWKRGADLIARLGRKRAEDEGWLGIARKFSERVYEDKLLDEDTLRRLRDLDGELNEFGYDPFGFSPEHLKYLLPAAAWLFRKYFRVETYGIDKIPEGPVLLISNHSGQLPVDGMMIATACILDKEKPRIIRSMIERWVPTIPVVSWVFNRAGQIVGTRDNFRRLIQQNAAVLVFPEGVVGINKTYDKAYQLQRFGYGFMRLALENKLPIVPVAVVGAEEQAMSFYNAKKVGKVLGMPAFPITPTFPWLGPAGMLPLPVKYHIYFGDPMYFEGSPNEEDKAISERVDRVKMQIQKMLDEGVNARTGIFF